MTEARKALALLLWCAVPVLVTGRGSHASDVLSVELGSSASLLRRERAEDGPLATHSARDFIEKKSDSTVADMPSEGGACNAGLCGQTRIVVHPGREPDVCAHEGHCTAQECCLGFCSGFNCPNGSAPMEESRLPQGCNGFDCTAQECCVGVCSGDQADCPGFSVVMTVEHRPELCEQHPCAPAECCLGTCGGVTCPAGSLRMNDTTRPTSCKSYPCTEQECCEASCHDNDLCSEGGAAGKELHANLTDAQGVPLPHIESMCEGFPCKPEECCVGTCHASVCAMKAPEKPAHLRPSQCKGWHCSSSECCEGRCSSLFCEHHQSWLKSGKNESSTCLDDPCGGDECCAGQCMPSGHRDESCPEDFGLTQKSTLPKECSGLNCTTQECCDSVCSEAVCPKDRGFILKEAHLRPARCSGVTCAYSECCVPNR